MYIVKRIKKKLKAWRNHVNIAEVQTLSDYLRENVFNDEALELLVYKDYESLANVAVYADFGVSTAIQVAFCMGYEAGKAGRRGMNKKNHKPATSRSDTMKLYQPCIFSRDRC